MCIIVTSILILTLLATLPSLAADTVKKVPTRDEIEDKYKWNLEDIYASTAAWEADLANAESMLPAIDSFKGRLGESGGTLFDFLKLHEKLWITVDQLYVYSYMKLDSDTRQSQYQELSDRIGAFDTRVVAAESFVRPEILAIEPSKLQGFFSQTPKLGDFRHYLEDIQRAREHTLTPEAEEVLASAGNIARGPNKLFTMLDDADIEYGTITDENGNKVELTKERYHKILESENRQVRREASEVYNGAYKNYMNTLAANLSNSVYSDVFFAKSRKYGSTLDYRLDQYNIPPSVVENLVAATNANFAPLHRYTALQKKVLGYDTLFTYDTSVPLVKGVEFEIPWDEAVEMVKKATEPLGKQYSADLANGFNSGWIDVYETEGKSSGAYSWGAYGTHPYVLMNYNGTVNAASTLAHEMGHAMHSFYSKQNQSYTNANYATFVAEVASTVNEILLNDYLMKTILDKNQKKYVVNKFIETVLGTYYVQVMFHEFEAETHDVVENGGSLSSESMTAMYHEIFQKYFGPDLYIPEGRDIGWARISHFYSAFYVYQYATSFSAATMIASRILEGDTKARDAYLEMLHSGGNDYPIELLKKAGVDMTKPDAINSVLTLFDTLVGEMEELTLN